METKCVHGHKNQQLQQNTAKTVIIETPKWANDVSLKWKCNKNTAHFVNGLFVTCWQIMLSFFFVRFVSIKVHHNFFSFDFSTPLYCWSISFNSEQKKVKFQFDFSFFFRRKKKYFFPGDWYINVFMYYYFMGQTCGCTCAYCLIKNTQSGTISSV